MKVKKKPYEPKISMIDLNVAIKLAQVIDASTLPFVHQQRPDLLSLIASGLYSSMKAKKNKL